MNETNSSRERLASRLGFILLSAGCAIGLGNVWRFPYIAGQNGGGWFVAIYLVFLVLIGLPVLLMEFAAGRAAQRSIAKLHSVLTPGKKSWSIHGVAGLLGCVILMMFYTVITGWMIIYFLKTASGSFAGLSPVQIGAEFGAMLSDPIRQIGAMVFASAFATVICVMGLQKGVERITKWMMSMMLVLLVVLAVNSVMLDGAQKGVSFYLVPDFERMRSVGVAKVIVEAMNHALFTLSLGIGAMAIFGSYIDKKHTILKEGVNVAFLDTFVAIIAGLVIIPACFAFNVDQTQGPGLVFVTLPNVFNSMPLGRFRGSMFFLFMSCAALTTVVTVFESIVAALRDYLGWSRVKTGLITGVAISILSLPCIFGFGAWKSFQPFGEGSCVCDLEDFVVSNLILPLGCLAFAIYCCHRCGWGWKGFRDEVNAGAGVKLAAGPVRIYCQYILPVIVLVIFVIGMLDKFHVDYLGFLSHLFN